LGANGINKGLQHFTLMQRGDFAFVKCL